MDGSPRRRRTACAGLTCRRAAGLGRSLARPRDVMHKEALVANTAWQIRGQYLETCNCAYLCPCILTHSAARPTQGNCTVAMVFHVEQGRYGDVALDGLSFAVLARTPGPMREPNWSVGLIVDRQASPAQQEALTKIGSGGAGGPAG